MNLPARVRLSRKATIAGSAVFAAIALATGAASGQVVAHWSFDTSTLSFDGGGNITGAADSSGNHNATAGANIGGTGGIQYSSQVIPGTASVTGQFGQGLMLTGNGTSGTFMTFNQLTELMRANGAPSYTVSMWLNTTATVSHSLNIMSNWGLTNSGSRFAYGWGFQFSGGNAQMRGQTRTIAPNTTGNGSDIYAQAVTVGGALTNGSWHMLTWTFDTTAGNLLSYFDGNLVNTFHSTQALGYQLLDATSLFGAFGLKGDTGAFINGAVSLDEVWVFNEVLDGGTVQTLYNLDTIPEPGALTLFGAGALFLCLIRRRK